MSQTSQTTGHLSKTSLAILRGVAAGDNEEIVSIQRGTLAALLGEVDEYRRAQQDAERTVTDNLTAARRRLLETIRDWYAGPGNRADLVTLCTAAIGGWSWATARILDAIGAVDATPLFPDAGPDLGETDAEAEAGQAGQADQDDRGDVDASVGAGAEGDPTDGEGGGASP